jgi:putative MATE family efflux protein
MPDGPGKRDSTDDEYPSEHDEREDAGPVARLREVVERRISVVFKSRDEFDLTSGDIAKPLFYLSLPIVITNLLQTMYNLADTVWLGQYSTEALAAISFAFPAIFFLIALGMGISIAGSILVAQNTGAGDEEQAEFAASQTVTFSIVASIILGAIGYFIVGDVLSFLGASEDVLPLATNYLQVISLGMVFMFAFFVFMSLMRGYGDTITPMLVMFGTVVLNILIDPILIFGFESNPLFAWTGTVGIQEWLFTQTSYTGHGVEGAAIATIFSRMLATVVGFAIMFSGRRGVQIHLGQMVPDFQYLKKILRVGVPASIEGTGNAIAVNLMLLIVGMFPTTVVAAYGVGVRMFSVIFLPAIAVGRGVETMAGQNIGADKEDRAGTATHFAAKAMFLILAGVGVATWLGAGSIVSIFSNDPEVVETGRLFLRYVAPTFGFTGIFHVYKGGFRGAGKTAVAAAISIAMLGVIRVPVAYVGALLMGPNGIWAAFSVANIAGAAIAFTWFMRGTWRDVDITEDRDPGYDPPEPEPEPTTDD